jgi:site-specific DNA-methyltransferase (adenine-specific)
MAGGRGLDDFRDGMLSDTRLSKIVDYSDSTDAFPGVSVKGGVCYFLWNKNHDGLCEVTRIVGNTKVVQKPRALSEFDVLVRQEESLEILRKVNRASKATVMDMVSGDTPFGLATNFGDHHASPGSSDVELHLVSEGKRQVRYTNRSNISKNLDLIDNWKVFVPEAYGAGEGFPHQILGKPIVAAPGSVCTQTYLAVGPFESEEFAKVFESYYRTKFFRFVVSLRKITQHAIRSTYKWVPLENQTTLLTDSDLFRKYALTDAEVNFIESMIRPMDSTDA